MYFPVCLHLWHLLMLIFSETDAKISMPSYSLESLKYSLGRKGKGVLQDRHGARVSETLA